jgi:hypothetical protein
MNFEDELQRRFDDAGTALELQPGSLSAVQQRARRIQTRRRVATTSAALLVLVGLGVFAATLSGGSDADTESVGTEQGLTPTTNPGGTGDARLQPGDLTYVGAFMAPAADVGGSTFAYGGEAAAYFADGDPGGTDDYTGSLFMTGHPRQNLGVAEISIPPPTRHNGTSDGLAVATVLQPFADITDGRASEVVDEPPIDGEEEYRYGGLAVVDGPDGPRLHWSVRESYDVTAGSAPGHGHSSLDLAAPDPAGPWYLAENDNRATAGYVFSVPESFANSALDGNNLITGHKADPTTFAESWGPPFFAYRAPDDSPVGTRLATEVLTFYADEDAALADFGVVDTASGATWVARTDGADAIVTVGRRGLGEVHRGEPRAEDCSVDGGQHGGPYEPLILFYDPKDLAAVAAGDLAADAVEPYRSWNPAEHLIETCDWLLTSVSFDAAAGRLYVVQAKADVSQNEFSPVPVVHVFEL